MRYCTVLLGALISAQTVLAAATEAKWTNATGNGLWNDAGNWSIGSVPNLDNYVRIEAYNEDVTIDLGTDGASVNQFNLPSGNRHRVILTGTGAYTHAATASSSFVGNRGSSLIEFRCPVVIDRSGSSISYGAVFKGAVTVNAGNLLINGTADKEYSGNEEFLRCEFRGPLTMPGGGSLYPGVSGNCKVFIEEGAEVTVGSVELGTNGWLQVNGGQLTVTNRIQTANALAGSFGPRFVQVGGRTTCTGNNKPVSFFYGEFKLQGGVFKTPCDGAEGDGLYLRDSPREHTLVVSGGDLSTGFFSIAPTNTSVSLTGGTVHLVRTSNYTAPYFYTGSGAVDALKVNCEIQPPVVDGETTVLNSTLYATNGVTSRFYLPLGGEFTLSGSGAVFMNRFYMSGGNGTSPTHLNLSGVAFNFGPGTNNCKYAQSTLGLSNSASIGAFGADETAWAGNRITLLINGAASVRTTDAVDGTTPRLISSFLTEFAAAGELTVSGNGAFRPNLQTAASFKSLTLTDGARLVLESGYGMTVETMSLSENAKIEVAVPEGSTLSSIAVLSSENLPADIADHLIVSGAGATGLSVVVRDNTVMLYRESTAEGVEWVGLGTDNKWTTAANWNNGVLPQNKDAVVFGGISRLTVDNDSTVSPSNIWFRGSAGAFTIGGNPLTVSGPVTNVEVAAGVRPEHAAVRNSSAFAQTFDTPVTLSAHHACVWCDDVQPIVFKQGLNNVAGAVLVVRGTVKLGGTSQLLRYVRFCPSGTATPSCLHVLPGGDVTLADQGDIALSDYNMTGRFAVDAGGRLTLASPGRLEFRDPETIVVNGELNANGYFATDVSDTTFSGTGTVYVAATHSGGHSTSGYFKRFVGTDGLTLRLGGDWTTVEDDPNRRNSASNSVGLALRNGTKLVLANNASYGPKAGTGATRSTREDRKAIFTDTVTVDTAGYHLAFVDPLDASAATLVKTGAGRLTLSSDSLVRDLAVSNGCVRPAALPLALSGRLSLSEEAVVESPAGGMPEWTTLATAQEITAPTGDWRVGRVKYRVTSVDGRPALQGCSLTGFVLIVR